MRPTPWLKSIVPALLLAGCARGQQVQVTNAATEPTQVVLDFGGRSVTASVDSGATRTLDLWQGEPPSSLDVTAKWPNRVTHAIVLRPAYPKGNPWRVKVTPSDVLVGEGSKLPSIPSMLALALAAVLLSWAWRVLRFKSKAPQP